MYRSLSSHRHYSIELFPLVSLPKTDKLNSKDCEIHHNMSESTDDTRVWHYSDVNGAQKGPVPTVVLSRLLEKGVGVTAQTLVWKAGMDNWLPVSNVS